MTPEAFTHIALSLRPKLQAIGRRFFADSGKADDVAQEVLMRLWLMRDRIDLRQGVEPLAVRMAKNYCVNEWRREQRTQAFSDMSESFDAVGTGGIPRSQWDEPASDGRETCLVPASGWETMLNALAPYEQRLVRLRYEWDMPVQEMATIMGITPRSVSSILSTAKRKLQQQLKKGEQQ